MFSCAGSDTIISDRCFYIIITYYLYVSFVSAVLVDGHFRRHVDLKLSCYIKGYLQTAGVKYRLLLLILNNSVQFINLFVTRYFIAVVFIVLILYYSYLLVLEQ